MTLDAQSLQLAMIVVVSVVSGSFVLEVASRGRSPVDLIWTLAFVGPIGAAVCYLAAAWTDSLWWFVGLGNACAVLTPFAMWNGIRADDGRRPLLGVSGAVVTLTALAAILRGPDGGPWAGGWALLAFAAVGAGLAGIAGLRGRLHRHRLGGMLTAILLIASGYYGVRTAVYLAVGHESDVFTRYLGTATTSIVVLALVAAAGYAMIAVRTEEIHLSRSERYGFDPVTGLRTPWSFERRVRDLLSAAEQSAEPVALVTVAIEGVDHLRTAFHPGAADDALTLVVDNARLLAPPVSLSVRTSPDEHAFDVVLRRYTGAEAHAWAERLRRQVIATPLQLDGTRVRLRVTIGVAGDAECGYDLAALRATARQRLTTALDQGGNRIASWF